MASHKFAWLKGLVGASPLTVAAFLLQGLGYNAVQAESIYTCVDKNGRSYLSDKRIPECLDVVQTELGKSGVFRRHIAPETNLSNGNAQTDGATGAEAAKEKALRDVRQQKALLDRYPNEATHSTERKRALAPVDESIKSINTQTNQHLLQRQALVQEQAGYKVKQAAVPPELQQKINETDALLTLLNRQLSERMYERQRINQRFDTEINQLRQLWDKASASKGK